MLTVIARGVGGRDTGECALTWASGNAGMRGAWGAERDGAQQGRGDAGHSGMRGALSVRGRRRSPEPR